MSLRSLIEFNHDYSVRDQADLLSALQRYINSASKETAADLERFGLRVVGMRHHSSAFVVPEGTDGFPVSYLAAPSKEAPQ